MSKNFTAINDEFYFQTVMNLLAPVAQYLRDDRVSEVLINGPAEIYVESGGVLEPAPPDVRFEDESALRAAALNIAQYVGRQLNAERPILDARLPDGSRVHVVIPPVSRQGTLISIRRFRRIPMTIEELIANGTISERAATALDLAVRLRRNIVIAGGTGSGKTSLLNSIATLIPASERIIVIEDASELQLSQPHSVYLEAQTGDMEERGKVTITDLFRSALRLRPDRILIGEVRGGEALDMVQSMISGHSGSISTTHAETPTDCLRRIETLAMYSGVNIPQSAIRAQVASAIHLVLVIRRMSGGARVVTEIAEVGPLAATGDYQVRDIFTWKAAATREGDPPKGALEATGLEPAYATLARARGIRVHPKLFAAPTA